VTVGRTTLDRRLFTLVNHLPHTPYVDAQVSLLSDLGKGIGWAAAAGWLALRDGRRGQRAALASTAGMLLAIVIVQGPVKIAFQRRRPFVSRVVRVVGPRARDASFPSGHTAGSFAAAAALGGFYPRDRLLLLALASAVGASRVYLGHHFPGDVAAGAGLGIAIGTVVRRLTRLAEPRT
jgi:undecaprenyl-diphosphatase